MKKTNTYTLFLTIGILIIVNLISENFYFRIDLTEDKQYTLSRATKNIMKSLEDPVTVKAYFSENLPPHIAKTKKDFEEYLIEYSRISNDNLVYQFINPNKNNEKEQEALNAGIHPVMINVREKNQMKQQKAFLGAVLELEEQKEIIPFINPGAPLEYMMSSAIKKIALQDKHPVGLLQGFGQPKIEEMTQVKKELDILYDFKTYTIDSLKPLTNNEFKTLALIKPKDSIKQFFFDQLDDFLDNGGNLLIALNNVEGDLNNNYGTRIYTGVSDWLKEKGIFVKDNFVIDSQCAEVSVQQQQGIFTYNTRVSFPYIPIINKFSDHPITKGLEAVVMQFTSSIEFNSKDSLKVFSPIAFSSENSGSLNAPLYFNIQKKWTTNDFPLRNQVVAGILEQTLPNGNISKICIIGDGDFAINGQGRQQVQLQRDNVNLMVNAIDWLSDDTGLVDLRTKGIEFRPIDSSLKDKTKTLLKYLNFIIPILGVIIYGIIRVQINRNKRIKRIEESYE